jgi:hypothetical protein
MSSRGDEIVRNLSKENRLLVTEKMIELERKLRRQDSDLADSLIRVLKGPLGKQLRNRIKEIANATD